MIEGQTEILNINAGATVTAEVWKEVTVKMIARIECDIEGQLTFLVPLNATPEEIAALANEQYGTETEWDRGSVDAEEGDIQYATASIHPGDSDE